MFIYLRDRNFFFIYSHVSKDEFQVKIAKIDEQTKYKVFLMTLRQKDKPIIFLLMYSPICNTLIKQAPENRIKYSYSQSSHII